MNRSDCVILAYPRLSVAESANVTLEPEPLLGLTCTVIEAAAAVVKVHVTVLPNAIPLVSVTVPATVTVYVVPTANADVGVSVAVAPETLIDAATFDDAPAARSVKVVEVKVAGAMARLKIAETVAVVATPVAPAAGDWLTITGGFGTFTTSVAVAL